MKLEALIPVLKGEMPLKAHAHRADDICTAIRIAKEFGVKMTLEHCTEGHLIADKVAAVPASPVAVGPTLTNASKIELANKTFDTPGVLASAGLPGEHHHRRPGDPPAVSAPVRRAGGEGGDGPLRRRSRPSPLNPATSPGRGGPGGFPGSGQGRRRGSSADGDPMVSDTHVLTVFVNGRQVVG